MATNNVTQQPLTAITSDITFSDTGTIEIGSIPPGSVLVDAKVNVTTAYDSATSDSLSIGYGAFGSTSADTDAFEAAIDLQSTGNAALTLLNVGVAIDSDVNVPITLTTTSVGGSLAAGAASVIFIYAQK